MPISSGPHSLERTIGKLEAQMEALTKQMEAQNTKLDAVEKTLSEARGGWRVLLLVGGAFGAIGALVGRLMQSVLG